MIHSLPLSVEKFVRATYFHQQPRQEPDRHQITHEPRWAATSVRDAVMPALDADNCGAAYAAVRVWPMHEKAIRGGAVRNEVISNGAIYRVAARQPVVHECGTWGRCGVHGKQPLGVVLSFHGRILTEGMTKPSPPSDAQDHAAMITAVAQRRDRDAFGELYRYFGSRVKAWMLRSGATPTAAEEIAQETMLLVWRKAASFDPARSSATTWIFTIARNLRIDAVRRERHPGALLPDPAEDAEPPETADHALVAAERDRRIRIALSRLPAEQATVIQKAYFEDKAHAEIEKELGIPLGTVKSRLRLAMNRLRAVLGDLA